MLTWIQHHMIRHGRWIFITLLAVIIVAFVFTIGNTPGCTTPRTPYESIEFYGYDLRSEIEIRRIRQMTELSIILQTGRPAQSNEQLQRLLLSRIALLHLADAIGIPAPDKALLTEFVQGMAMFQNPATGGFDRARYLQMVDAVDADPQYSSGLLTQVFEDDYRIQQINDVLGGPGYYLPDEAVLQAERSSTRYGLQTASLDYTSFEPELEIDEAALQDYYAQHRNEYEIPERVKAGYVLFKNAAFESGVDGVEESVLRDYFIKNRERFVAAHEAAATAPDASPGEATPDVTFADVRDAVTKEYRTVRATRLANEAATQFAYKLYDQEIELDSAGYATLLSEFGVGETALRPYSASTLSSMGLPIDLLRAGLTLNANRYFSDAYEVPGGFAVLIYRGRIDPEIPPYEYVANKVKDDYLTREKKRLFEERGETLRKTLETAIGTGAASFAATADAQGLETAEYESFESEDLPENLPRVLFSAAEGLEQGEISRMITTGGKGYLVYVAEKTVPEITEDHEDYASAVDYLQRYATFLSRNNTLQGLIDAGGPETGL